MAGLHIENCHGVSISDVEFRGGDVGIEVGPGCSVDVFDCKASNLKGPAILRHPDSRVSVRNFEASDRLDPNVTKDAISKFRTKYEISDAISDEEIGDLSQQIAVCSNRVQRERVLRKSAIYPFLKSYARRHHKSLKLVLGAFLAGLAYVADVITVYNQLYSSSEEREIFGDVTQDSNFKNTGIVPIPPKKPSQRH